VRQLTQLNVCYSASKFISSLPLPGHGLPIIYSDSLSFERLVRILYLPNGLRWHLGYIR